MSAFRCSKRFDRECQLNPIEESSSPQPSPPWEEREFCFAIPPNLFSFYKMTLVDIHFLLLPYEKELGIHTPLYYN